MFPKYPLFLTVLGVRCQKGRLHTDLTLTEHPFGQSWPAKGWNPDALAEEGCSWYVSRNIVEYSETAALWLVWEKESSLKGVTRSGLHKHSCSTVVLPLPSVTSSQYEAKESACCSRSTVTNLAVLITRQMEAWVYWHSWQHTEERVNLSCESFLWCHIPRVLTK